MFDAQSIVVDESLTFVEKIMSLNKISQDGTVKAGDTTVLNVDLAMAQDSTGPLAIRSLNEMNIEELWDPARIFLVIDHTFPAADEKVANLHSMIRKFASKHSCMIEEGNISHQWILEKLAAPGMIIFGADSHTCQAGCVGAFATGIGSTEMAAIWASGQIWVNVPETFQINLQGDLPVGVYARDIILNYIGDVGEDGANYKALEWSGPLSSKLSVESRACIANASMECGAKSASFSVDESTKYFLEESGRKYHRIVNPGKNAEYAEKYYVECGKLEPIVTGPDQVDKVQTVSEASGIEIDQAFIGSATNGRIEDLEVAAHILSKGKVHAGTRCIVTPASMKVYEEAIRRGYVSTFIAAGAVFTNATCGACVGTHLGALGENEICISSSSRNFVGRMGPTSSKIYLSSPATVAASAIEGRIADPRRYLKDD